MGDARTVPTSQQDVTPLLPSRFQRHDANPVLAPVGDGWQSANTYNAAAALHGEKVVLVYRAHATDGISRLGYAASEDGLEFNRESDPVLEPTESYELRGCEDPRLTKIDETYYLTYTGFDGFSALLCLATSRDLRTWTKHGPMLPDLDTWRTVPWMAARRGPRPWSKAGAILPVPLGGLWHMYVGEGAIYHATSRDLVTWSVDDDPVLAPRAASWDRDLVEVGTPPVLQGDRVVLYVNGAVITSVERREVEYACGRVDFDRNEATRVVARDLQPLLTPESPQERAGLVPNVVFAEGLVHHRDQWLLYFGQSDTTIGVAMGETSMPRTW